MNIKQIKLLTLTLLSSIVFFSCNKDDNDTDYSGLTNDAQIYSFSLTAPILENGDPTSRAKDSLRIKIVNETNYAIDQQASIIYNPDSLPYLTKLKNVTVKLSFNPSYGVSSVQVQTPDSLYYWNTTDSINFSKLPVKFIVTSRGETKKTYNIDVRTHKINPDLIVWKQMSSFVALGYSKTLLVDNTFYTYVLDGSVKLSTSSKSSISWSSKTVSGLPANLIMESFTYVNSKYNVIDKNGNSYISTDGLSWVKANNSMLVKTIVGVVPENQKNNLLVVIENAGYYFAQGSSLSDLKLIEKIAGSSSTQIPSNFPIQGLASYSNTSEISSDPMLMVTGGISQNNSKVSTTWLIKSSNGTIEITPTVQKPMFDGGDGLSAFGYNRQYYVLQSKQFYISDNWGQAWTKAPEGQNLDSKIQTVKGQTLIVDKDNYIWILGGVTSAGAYSNQVWRGRLNKLIP